MLRLWRAPPLWCHTNPEKWLCFDAEYFIMNVNYSKILENTLEYLKQTWLHMQTRENLTWQQINSCALKVGKTHERCRLFLQWPREMA